MNRTLGVSARPRRLKQTKMHEYLMRFVFGGVVAVGAGLVGNWWGAAIGGLFLAFPSILPGKPHAGEGARQVERRGRGRRSGRGFGQFGTASVRGSGLAASRAGAGLVDVACCLLDLDSRCRHRLDCVPVLAPGASTRRVGGCQPPADSSTSPSLRRQSTKRASRINRPPRQ